MSDVEVLLPTRPFWFVRHGQTDWNVEGRLQGLTDIPLNQTGIEQAMAAAEALKNTGISRIFSSPLQRAKTTAEVVGGLLETPVAFHDNLTEQHFGSWEGCLIADLVAQYGLTPHTPFAHLLPPDSEPWEHTCRRITRCIANVLAENPHETVLFVGHFASFAALHETLCGTRPLLANAAPTRFAPTDTGWVAQPLDKDNILSTL